MVEEQREPVPGEVEREQPHQEAEATDHAWSSRHQVVEEAGSCALFVQVAVATQKDAQARALATEWRSMAAQLATATTGVGPHQTSKRGLRSVVWHIASSPR